VKDGSIQSEGCKRFWQLCGGFSGHEDGCIRVWDTRTCGKAKATYKFFDNDDEESAYDVCEVNAVCYRDDKHCILAAIGGRLAVYDTRKGKMQAISEGDDELMSLTVCKNGKKVVAATQEGWLELFSWGHFEDFSDRCYSCAFDGSLHTLCLGCHLAGCTHQLHSLSQSTW
jgi:WD40 repeat protein